MKKLWMLVYFAWFIEPVLSALCESSTGTRCYSIAGSTGCTLETCKSAICYVAKLAYLLALYDCHLRQYIYLNPQTWEQTICHTRLVSFLKSTPAYGFATPTQLLQALVRLITQQTPQWTLFLWRETFNAFWRHEWQSPQWKHIMQAGRYTRNSWLNGIIPNTLPQTERLTLLFMLMLKHRGDTYHWGVSSRPQVLSLTRRPRMCHTFIPYPICRPRLSIRAIKQGNAGKG